MLRFNKEVALRTARDKELLIIEDIVYISNYKKTLVDGTLSYYWKCRQCGMSIATHKEADGSHVQQLPRKRVLTTHYDDGSCKINSADLFHQMARQQIIAASVHVENAYELIRESMQDPSVSSVSYVRGNHISDFPSKISLSSAISRARQRVRPPLPATTAEIDIPFDHPLNFLPPTHDGQRHRFVYVKNCILEQNNKMVLFFTDNFFRYMCNGENLFMDGNFKVVPPVFQAHNRSGQLYSIHSIVGDRSIPHLFALLPGKSEAIYDRLFTEIREYAASSNIAILWRTVTTDFEKAAQNSLRRHFPTITLKGCYFHFCQAIWDRINSEAQLRYLYKRNNDFPFRKFARGAMALAFLPVDQVRQGWEFLCQRYNVSDHMEYVSQHVQGFIRYYERQWLSTDEQLTLWNVSERGNDRTNNRVEGWHYYLVLKFRRHPQFWKFIDLLKDEQVANDLELSSINRGTYHECVELFIYCQGMLSEKLEQSTYG